MEQVLTLVVKLDTSTEQSSQLRETALAFANACCWINENVEPKLANRNSVQAVCYSDVKKQFGLTANHVVRAGAKVAANRQTAKQTGSKIKNYKPTSFDGDQRTFSLREKDWTVSVSTTRKRLRLPLKASNYHRGKLTGRKPTSAQICEHRDGCWYAHMQLRSTPPAPMETENVIGVDFGRREIAKTSHKQGWDGYNLQQKRDKYSRRRPSLPKKASQGTRSTRRRCRQILKRLSGREKRFQNWVNHNISSVIIEQAKQTRSLIAMENLTGIRESTNQQPRNKQEKRRSNNWAFHQLRLFVEYKAIKEGVEVVAIPPAYTSQTCHKCKHLGVRSNKNFKCSNPECGWKGDADFNGAQVIKLWGCTVNQPRGSW
ncbi:MAG: transposase [Cyanobacteria bacterium SW_8_48_13]|nr:MAG: transposase [Cyanobacteria bacterium SW_8_48_13]